MLFSSIIAFSNQSTFKFKEEFMRAKVIHFPVIHKTIKGHTREEMNHEDLQEINHKLDKLMITDKKAKKRINKEHVQSLKIERQKEKNL